MFQKLIIFQANTFLIFSGLLDQEIANPTRMETADPVSVVGEEEDLAVVVEVGVDLEATAEVDSEAEEEA